MAQPSHDHVAPGQKAGDGCYLIFGHIRQCHQGTLPYCCDTTDGAACQL